MSHDPLFDDPAWYRALTLAERAALLRDAPDRPAGAAPSSPAAARRLRRWRSQKPFDNDDHFAERLGQVGLTPSGLEEVLDAAPERLRSLCPRRPLWLDELESAYRSPVDDRGELFPGADELDPAEMAVLELWRPLIRRAVRRLERRLEKLVQEADEPPFDPGTASGLMVRQLVPRLLVVTGRTFFLELNVARLEGRLAGNTAEERFRSFRDLLGTREGALGLLLEYPVLARAAVRSIGRWLAAYEELAERLCADLELIRRTFPHCAGPLEGLFGGAGDPHRGGRTVAILDFASGGRLVYKPRPLAGERRFQQLLAWFNRRSAVPELRTLEVIDRGAYGWVEFVEAGPCGSEAEIERFYERQGSLLALLYLLEANDFHYQNLIAAGEHPVLVDLESLLQPRLAQLDGDTAGRLAANSVNYSVARTGLLPRRSWLTEEFEGLDVSALGGAEGQLTPHGGVTVAERGTDRMRLVLEQQRLPAGQHRPVLAGRPSDVLAHSDALLRGFRSGYQTLAVHRTELVGPDGVLERFGGDEMRVILRPTRTYALLLGDSFHPDYLRDALERDRHLDKLWIGRAGWNALAELIPAERDQLEAGDIPLFYARPGDRDLFSAEGRRFAGFSRERALEHVERRSRTLGERDLDLQVWLIRASLAILEPDAGHGRPGGYRVEMGSGETLRTEALVRAARAVGDRLLELAIRGSDGKVAWIGLKDDFQRFVAPVTLGLELYDGLPGVAIFLAHLEAMTGEAKYGELAEAAWRMVDDLRTREELESEAVGAFGGWGGLALSMLYLGALWERDDLLTAAEEIGCRLPELALREPSLDVVHGTAGALATVLGLHRVRCSPDLLDAARRLGDRLVATAIPAGGGLGWPTRRPSEPPLTGFSHGASGIAWALLGLTERTGEERYREVAEQGFRFERSRFSPETGNWLDHRLESQGEAYGLSWCHGAPGIGLARAARLALLERDGERPDLRTDICRALETTVQRGFGGNQCLCHGDLGNLELLLTAGEALDEPSWIERARALGAAIVERIERDGPRCGLPGGLENPGLMTGLAGIGYGLLRLAAPEQVPSILLVEAPAAQAVQHAGQPPTPPVLRLTIE